MYRHISIFTLKDKSETEHFVSMLQEVGKNPAVISNEIGVNLTKIEKEGPAFGDVVQVIDFETKEDLDAYPASKEHMRLLQDGPEMLQVSAIDYEK